MDENISLYMYETSVTSDPWAYQCCVRMTDNKSTNQSNFFLKRAILRLISYTANKAVALIWKEELFQWRGVQ